MLYCTRCKVISLPYWPLSLGTDPHISHSFRPHSVPVLLFLARIAFWILPSTTLNMASQHYTPKPITDIFTSDTSIDRRQCHRTVPMRVLALGLGRTGTACMPLPHSPTMAYPNSCPISLENSPEGPQLHRHLSHDVRLRRESPRLPHVARRICREI